MEFIPKSSIVDHPDGPWQTCLKVIVCHFLDLFHVLFLTAEVYLPPFTTITIGACEILCRPHQIKRASAWTQTQILNMSVHLHSTSDELHLTNFLSIICLWINISTCNLRLKNLSFWWRPNVSTNQHNLRSSVSLVFHLRPRRDKPSLGARSLFLYLNSWAICEWWVVQIN